MPFTLVQWAEMNGVRPRGFELAGVSEQPFVPDARGEYSLPDAFGDVAAVVLVGELALGRVARLELLASSTATCPRSPIRCR